MALATTNPSFIAGVYSAARAAHRFPLRAAQYLIMLLWILVILASGWLNHTSWRSHLLEMAETSAAAFVDQVMLTRYWNASHGRVYVPVTTDSQPNPYLNASDRDIVGSDGTLLTQINPAYMTRQISEMTNALSYVSFHLTSDRPLRPGNEPNAIEAEALAQFELDPTPFSRLIESDAGDTFFYMEPVFVEQPCLRCHADQGYVEGNVRGGISVSIPMSFSSMPTLVHASHTAMLIIGLVGIYTLFRTLRANFKLIKQQANHDPLTGLLNRRKLEWLLEREIQRSVRQETPICLLVIDLDCFKRINDQFGHAAGDHALRDLAGLLLSHTRVGGDTVGRLAGDEFMVLMGDADIEAGLALAERLRGAAEQHRVEIPGGMSFGFTLSIGVVERGETEQTGDKMFARADRALYRCKGLGRNRVCTAWPAGQSGPAEGSPETARSNSLSTSATP